MTTITFTEPEKRFIVRVVADFLTVDHEDGETQIGQAVLKTLAGISEPTLTAQRYDILSRAISVIEESDEGDGRDAHAELIGELRVLTAELKTETPAVTAIIPDSKDPRVCPACHDGRRTPDEKDRRLTFEDNSVQVFCRQCGRCIQA